MLYELNESSISPYCLISLFTDELLSGSTSRQVLVFQLTYIDDSTLIANFKLGLIHLLNTAQEFYSLTNILANLQKYVLLSLKYLNKSITFHLQKPFIDNEFDFTVLSLSTSASFRFLSVWFNLHSSPMFVIKQLRKEFCSFAARISSKKLFIQQLTYLYNMVLMPHVEYQAQLTHLLPSIYFSISASACITLKKCAHLMITFFSCLLSSRHHLNLQLLFDRLLYQ